LKKIKNVQDVTKETTKSEPSPEPVQVASKEEAPTTDNKEGTQPVEALIEIPQIDEDTKKMLQKAGFSWDSITNAFTKINVWAEKVESTQKALTEAIKGVSNEGIAEALNKKLQAGAEKQRAELAEKMKNVPQDAGQGEKLGIGDILKFLGKGDGGSNPFQEKMNKVMDAALDKVLEKINNPSRFEQLLDEEIAKTKIKAIAAMTIEGTK
jgi:hypothetical protein